MIAGGIGKARSSKRPAEMGCGFRTKQDGQDFAGLTGYTMRFF